MLRRKSRFEEELARDTCERQVELERQIQVGQQRDCEDVLNDFNEFIWEAQSVTYRPNWNRLSPEIYEEIARKALACLPALRELQKRERDKSAL